MEWTNSGRRKFYERKLLDKCCVQGLGHRLIAPNISCHVHFLLWNAERWESQRQFHFSVMRDVHAVVHFSFVKFVISMQISLMFVVDHCSVVVVVAIFEIIFLRFHSTIYDARAAYNGEAHWRIVKSLLMSLASSWIIWMQMEIIYKCVLRYGACNV